MAFNWKPTIAKKKKWPDTEMKLIPGWGYSCKQTLTRRNHLNSTFLVRSPKDGELLGLEWGMILQVGSIIFPGENSGVRCQYSRESDKRWCLNWRKRSWKFFVRPHVVMGKYLLAEHGPLSSLFIKYNSNRAIIAGLVICFCAGICVTVDVNVIEDFILSFFFVFTSPTRTLRHVLWWRLPCLSV